MIYKRRRIASIDIGSNSVLMVVAERDEEGVLTVLSDQIQFTRLAEGLRATKELKPQAIQRTCDTLRSYAEKAKTSNVQEVVVTATAAVREAKNKDVFLAEAQGAVGCEIEVIPPNEEARLAYLSVTTEPGGSAPSMVVDIGGGSTEVTWGIGPRFDGGRSLDLGTVKLIEGPLKGNPPSVAAIEEARKEIDQRLSRITPLGKLDYYYGTAGTFTQMAALDLALPRYHSTLVTGCRLTEEKNAGWVKRLSTLTTSEMKGLPGCDPERADVILGGALIIERLMKKFENRSFTVSDRGVRFGKLFDKLRGFVPPVKFA